MADNITGINNPTGIGSTTAPGNGGFGDTATGLAQTAQEYAGKVSDAALHAKEYVTDKVNIVGELQRLRAQESRSGDFDFRRRRTVAGDFGPRASLIPQRETSSFSIVRKGNCYGHQNGYGAGESPGAARRRRTSSDVGYQAW
jgi:hypothetical protein